MVRLIQAGIQIAVRIRRIYQIGIVGKDTHPWRIRTLIRIIFIGHISQFVGIPSGRLIRHIVCHRIANVCDLAAITAFEGCSFRVRESPIDIWHNSVVRAERAYVSDIIEIEVSQPEFNGISSEEQKKSFLSALSQIKSTFVMLYDISISLDTGATDETKAKIEIIAANGDLEVAHKKISRGESAIDGIYYQQISNTYSEIEDILNELKDYENINGVSLSSKIKFGYLSIIDKAKDLVDLIDNKI